MRHGHGVRALTVAAILCVTSAVNAAGPTAPIAAATQSSNQFAFDLYQQIRKQQGNLFFSPASISLALAMTYAGAAGRTASEMAEVLHIGRDEYIHAGDAELLNLLNSSGERDAYSLVTANRLWGTNAYPFEDTFLRLTKNSYRAELQSLNFGQPEAARRTINEWVAQQTREKIVDLVPSGLLSPDTRLVLTNAIYFRGDWMSAFSALGSRVAPFHAAEAETIDVPTMRQTHAFRYAQDGDVQILAMPYQGQALSMIIVLPKKVDGLAELEGKLTNARFVE